MMYTVCMLIYEAQRLFPNLLEKKKLRKHDIDVEKYSKEKLYLVQIKITDMLVGGYSYSTKLL